MCCFFRKKKEAPIVIKNPCPCVSCACWECELCSITRCPCLDLCDYSYGVNEYTAF